MDFANFTNKFCYHKCFQNFIIFYEEGNGARQSFISPRLATLYFTTSGKSFSKYTSICWHKLVHLMKYPRFLSENSP